VLHEALRGVASIALVPSRFSNRSLGEMSMFRSSRLACLLALGAIVSSMAHAYTPLSTSSSTSPGPTTLSYIGQNVPCHSSVTFLVSAAGAATITNFTATQGSEDSNFCFSITANSLPWTIGTATLVSNYTYSAQVSGVSVTVPGLHATCTQGPLDKVTMTLNDQFGTASFSGTLHTISGIPCGVSGTGLSTLLQAP